MKNLPIAEDFWTKALQKNPNDASILNNLGVISIMKEKFDESL